MTTRSQPSRPGAARALLAATVVPALAVAGAFACYLTWSGRLPERLATHWRNGTIDGYSGTTAFVAGALAIAVLIALAGTAVAVVALRRGRRPVTGAAGYLAGFATFPAVVLIAVLHANLDGAVSDSPPMLSIGLAIAGSVVAGVLAALIAGPAGRAPVRGGGLTADKPTVGLGTGERAAWTGGTTSSIGYLIAGAVAVTSALIWFLAPTPPPAAVLLIPVAVCLVVCVLLGRLTLTADAAGVTVRLGVPGLARRHVPLERISSAEVDTLSAFSYGGLGIRVNPVTGDTAYKLRGGPALVLNLDDGKRLLVSVDNPAGAAGLINDLLRAGTTSPESPLR
ncbi:DUF1648 domain-containing protein [Amycolatopsis antarctica]|uniref:DUF1648 domain-containing protein n=1 Tax=Amycolatopsis antarctica TaxID=1854586 RepID=A0A263D9F5_9PSEU|nr:hypothetical protein [Amycolatopsis antarctica]OZM74829.1 DUF1648 domain-containing protein [Amycolatopsis antarctica]